MSDAIQELTGEETARVEPMPLTPTMEDNRQQAYRSARAMFDVAPDWVTFFREVLGVDGLIRKMMPSEQTLKAFEQGPEYAEIQQMLAKLRDRSKHPTDCDEPTRVITVRLPKSLHESLRLEAHERKTSMNQLCISKLLQFIDGDLVPRD